MRVLHRAHFRAADFADMRVGSTAAQETSRERTLAMKFAAIALTLLGTTSIAVADPTLAVDASALIGWSYHYDSDGNTVRDHRTDDNGNHFRFRPRVPAPSPWMNLGTIQASGRTFLRSPMFERYHFDSLTMTVRGRVHL